MSATSAIDCRATPKPIQALIAAPAEDALAYTSFRRLARWDSAHLVGCKASDGSAIVIELDPWRVATVKLSAMEVGGLAAVAPFERLPAGLDALFAIALVLVVPMFLWTAFLFVRGWWAEAHPTRLARHDTDQFWWVFLVPALNEEVRIRDSVLRLLGITLAHRRVIVIDDAPDDATPRILAELAHPELVVLRR
jgi:hypothetical protein